MRKIGPKFSWDEVLTCPKCGHVGRPKKPNPTRDMHSPYDETRWAVHYGVEHDDTKTGEEAVVRCIRLCCPGCAYNELRQTMDQADAVDAPKPIDTSGVFLLGEKE